MIALSALTRRIEAAFRLMSERGMDAVAINHITEAADVGLGSFYNHFESKEAIYAAVNDLVFEGFADALDGAVKDMQDPTEVEAKARKISRRPLPAIERPPLSA